MMTRISAMSPALHYQDERHLDRSRLARAEVPRHFRAALCLCTIVCGLALRGYGLHLGLSAFVVKYGGSLLWGTMVFFLVAMAASKLSRQSIALISVMIAVCVELFRLVHAPWLDAFRLTLPGALLLGRIFSAWNVLAYGAGIVLAMALDRFGWRQRKIPPDAHEGSLHSAN